MSSATLNRRPCIEKCRCSIHAASGEWISASTPLRLDTNDPRDAGSVITYLRRYAALAICALAAEDDDGARGKPASKPKQEPPQQDGPPKPTLVERAMKLGLIPTADRVMFLDMCRQYIPACRGMQTMTRGLALAIEQFLRDELEKGK